MNNNDFTNSHFITDMDGVIYRDDDPLPGSIDLVNYLKNNHEITFLTNNSTKTPSQYVKKLNKIDIEVFEDQIMTSGKATALYLKDEIEDVSECFVIGGSGLISMIKGVGWDVVSFNEMKDRWEEINTVVMGWDQNFNFEKMKYATLAIRNGAKFIATNPDTTYPSNEGIIPGAGALISSVETASETEPKVIGKPNSLMFKEMTIDKDKDIYMVGDRLDTDIKFGKNIGAKTVLVLTGINNEEDLKNIPKGQLPDHVFKDAEELLKAIKSNKI